MKYLLLLLISFNLYASIIDSGPPSDALGNWKFDLYDFNGNQRGTTANPLAVTTSGADLSATGAITTTQSVTISTSGMATASFQVLGTWTGTIIAESSIDGGVTYSPETMIFDSGLIGLSMSVNNSGNINCAGYSHIRLRGLTVASGSAAITLRSTAATGVVQISNSLPQGGNNLGNIAGYGTAGTPVGGVITVQGTSGGTPLPTQLAAGNKYVGQVGLPQGTQDTFGAVIVAPRNNQIEIPFYTGNLGSLVSISNTGTAPVPSITGGHAVYHSGTGTTGYASGSTFQTIDYHSAHEVYSDFSVAFTTPTSASSYQRIGLYNSQEGFYIAYNGLTFQVCKRTSGVDTCTSKGSFSDDQLTGAAGSQFTRAGSPEAIDLTKLNIFRIRFGWLGAAPIEFEVGSPDGGWVLFHQIKQPNTSNSPSILNPNISMQIEVNKTASDATDLIMYTACWAGGSASSQPQNVAITGELVTKGQGSGLFADDFDLLDTTSKWNTPIVAGTATVAPSNSSLVFTTGTTTNNSGIITSRPTFSFDGGSSIDTGFEIQLSAAPIANSYKFWGRATYTGTAVQSGIGFEEDTAGVLSAVAYSGGTKIYSQVVSRPSDGNFHRYQVNVRPDAVYWYIDQRTGGDVPDAQSITHLNIPGAEPILLMSVNSASAPASAPTFNVMEVHVVNSAGTNLQLSDGVNPFIKANVKLANTPATAADNAVVVEVRPPTQCTYVVDSADLTPTVTAATDIYTIVGSATKTVKIKAILISGTKTTAGQNDFRIIKRSTANTGGTSTAIAIQPSDSSCAAATVTAKYYTVNPTALGTAISDFYSQRVYINSTAPGTSFNGPFTIASWDFDRMLSQSIILRGVNESININMDAGTITGAVFYITVVITEE